MPKSSRLLLILALLFTVNVNALPIEGHKVLISGPSRQATEVGRQIAASGGNVVDVAIGVALALSVTGPYFASLGGGGLALIKMNGSVDAIDFREVAPQATSRDYFKDLPKDASQTGGHAIAVPGIPAGLWAIHKKYGKLNWGKLFDGPLKLANKGFPVSGEWVSNTADESRRFNRRANQVFKKNGSQPYKPGEVLFQPELGRALAELKAKNSKGFYEGPVAKDIVQSVIAAGGKMTLQDLKSYKVRWLSPISMDFEGHKIYLMPPPSSGGVVIQTALKLIEKSDIKNRTIALSADEYHLLAEIEARAFRGRFLLGDPDFHQNPLAFLASDKYIEELNSSLNLKKSIALKPLDNKAPSPESSETTHLSVMDNEGHAVAMTLTLNGNYGSGVVTEQYGITLNNQMDDFTTRPSQPNMYNLIQGPGNEVEPGKRPLSSMSPTLVENNGRVTLAIGSPGGPRIISGVLQTLYRILVRGMDVDMAIQAARVHHQFLPNTLFVDRQRFSPEILTELGERGHNVQESPMGRVYVVRLRPDGILEAAYDSRGEGDAGGI